MDWQDSFATVAQGMSDAELSALAVACETRDPALVPGRTTVPATSTFTLRRPCECGCPLAVAAMRTGRESVGAVAGRFDDLVTADGADAGPFLRWVDSAPWPAALDKLAAEARSHLAARSGRAVA